MAGRDATRPCVSARTELAKRGRDRTRGFLTQLMATDAVDVTHARTPDLARDVLRDIGYTAEVLRRRHLHHRVLIARRIIVRRRCLVRRRHRRRFELLAGLAATLWQINGPEAPHPDLLVHFLGRVGIALAPL